MKSQRRNKKYQGVNGSSIVTEPLQSYSQQYPQFVGPMTQEAPVQFNATNQPVDMWQTSTVQRQPGESEMAYNAPTTIGSTMPTILQQRVAQQGQPGQQNPNGKGPKLKFNPHAALIWANGIALNKSQKFAEREQEDYVRANMNNPYGGMRATANGRSDNTRFGYQQYQEGGEVDDFYNNLMKEIENEAFGGGEEQIEAPTVEQVDQANQASQINIQEQQALLRKQIGRDIANGTGQFDFYNEPRRKNKFYADEEDTDGGIPTQYTAPQYGSVPAIPVNQAAQQAHQHYLSKGLPEHVSAGIIGNLMQESGLNTHIKGDGGKATGIAQWHPDRFKGLTNWAGKQGKNPYELTTQLDYILEEPGEGQKVLKKLLQTNSAGEAAVVFSNTYERPNKKFAANDKRAGYANSLIGSFGKGGTYYVDELDLLALQNSGVKYKIIND